MIFVLAHPLGIELMPHIRNQQDLHLFQPDAGARYQHIDGLFTATVDWALIEAHLPDLLRVALSMQARRLQPSAILRRLATYSRKNRLYFAVRELGRAVRTDFLLRYLSSIELRRVIQAATSKSELFNKYAQWISFGSASLVTAAEGHGTAITPEALAGTSPCLNEHLNRFGSYELDLSKPPAPLLFELPAWLKPSRQSAAVPV